MAKPKQPTSKADSTFDLLREYSRSRKRLGRKDGSIRRILSTARILEQYQPAIPTSPSEMERLVAALRRDGYAPTTINTSMSILNSAMRWKLGTSAPQASRVRETRKLVTILEESDQEKLINAARKAGPLDLLAVLLALDSGLRQKEISHLEWSDFQIQSDRFNVHIRDTKTYVDRLVPMTRRLTSSVLDMVATAEAEGKKLKGWVIPGTNGGERAGLNYLIDQLYRAADVKAAGWHILRRTWASRLAAAGVPLPTIMVLGGWSSLAVVNRYVTSTTEATQAAVRALDC